jgi:hypothetical protein
VLPKGQHAKSGREPTSSRLNRKNSCGHKIIRFAKQG